MLLAGPNGQGVVSTPASLCAQIVAPYPPRGAIGLASQSGNFVSSFLNYARFTGVGISRAVSAGNAAAVSVADYLDWYAERSRDARSASRTSKASPTAGALFERLRSIAQRQPLVILKGGTTAGGQRAAASHTGSLATDAAVFEGACRQAGITRAATVEEAFEVAATFATQPSPKGPRTIVITTAGGWGVVTADAITRSALELLALPDDLRDAIDEKLPPRWSRNNPIDLAGGETRDTIPEVLELVARHPQVDAIVYLGPGHPVEPGADAARRRLLPRSRSRAHRRVPRAPGRALRGGRRGDLRRNRQADPHRDRARDRRSRERGTRGRARERAASPTRRPTARCGHWSTSGSTRASASNGCRARRAERFPSRVARPRRAADRRRRCSPLRSSSSARIRTPTPRPHRRRPATDPSHRSGRRDAIPQVIARRRRRAALRHRDRRFRGAGSLHRGRRTIGPARPRRRDHSARAGVDAEVADRSRGAAASSVPITCSPRTLPPPPRSRTACSTVTSTSSATATPCCRRRPEPRASRRARAPRHR